MPDIHAGKGCAIGPTMTTRKKRELRLKDKKGEDKLCFFSKYC